MLVNRINDIAPGRDSGRECGQLDRKRNLLFCRYPFAIGCTCPLSVSDAFVRFLIDCNLNGYFVHS